MRAVIAGLFAVVLLIHPLAATANAQVSCTTIGSFTNCDGPAGSVTCTQLGTFTNCDGPGGSFTCTQLGSFMNCDGLSNPYQAPYSSPPLYYPAPPLPPSPGYVPSAPTAVDPSTLPEDEERKFSGSSQSKTKPFTLRGGTYLVKWRVRNPDKDWFCFVGIDLQRQGGGFYEHFTSESAEKKEVKGESYVSAVPAGTYTFSTHSYGSDCKWTISIEPD